MRVKRAKSWPVEQDRRLRRPSFRHVLNAMTFYIGLMSGAESIEKELLQSFRCFSWILAAIKYRMNKSDVILNSVVNRKRESLC